MSRVDRILSNIRRALTDPSQKRWLDSRLLSLIDEAQKDLATKAGLIRKTNIPVTVSADSSEQSFPSNIYSLTRVTDINKEPLRLATHYELDEENPSWENDTGTELEVIVYDLLSNEKYKVYPIVTAQTTINISYIAYPATITSANKNLEISEDNDNALQNFAIGMAFLDDVDTKDIEVAGEYLGLYKQALEKAIVDSANNYVRLSSREVDYNE